MNNGSAKKRSIAAVARREVSEQLLGKGVK
jgi:hypothetical protein